MSDSLKATIAFFFIGLVVASPIGIIIGKLLGLKAQYTPGAYYALGAIGFSFLVCWGLDRLFQDQSKKFDEVLEKIKRTNSPKAKQRLKKMISLP